MSVVTSLQKLAGTVLIVACVKFAGTILSLLCVKLKCLKLAVVFLRE